MSPNRSRALFALSSWILQLEDLGWITIPEDSPLRQQLRYLYGGVRDIRYHTAMEGAEEAITYANE